MRTEHAHTIRGVEGRMMNALTWRESHKGLPTFATQVWKASREYKEHGQRMRLTVTLGFDDDCRNGHNTFSATGDIDEYRDGRWRDVGGGMCHDDIARVFPELAPLLKWHLVSTDGPMHYLANTCFHASDRDHNGLLKGETRQRTGRSGKPMWELVARIGDGTMLRTPEKYTGADTVPTYALETLHVGESHPATPTLVWGPCMQTGEGKARELAHARSSAVWPEATDEELTAPDLKQRLQARLPALLAAFRADMEACGFEWEA